MEQEKKAKYKFLSKEATDRLYRIFFWPVKIVFSIFHPVRVIGKENIPKGAAVVAANHSTFSDPMLAICAFGMFNPLRIMGKESLFRTPVLGRIFMLFGMFGIIRGQNDMIAIKRALKVLKEGSKLMLFPEGTRVRSDEEAQDAKNGAIMFSVRTGAPLLPVYIPRKKHWFRFTKFVIGEPYMPDVPQRRASQEDYRIAADDLLRRIYALEAQTVKSAAK